MFSISEYEKPASNLEHQRISRNLEFIIYSPFDVILSEDTFISMRNLGRLFGPLLKEGKYELYSIAGGAWS